MKHVERIAYLLILAAAALYLWQPGLSPWLMGAGAIGIIVCHLHQKYGQGDLRQRRIRRLRHILGLVYAITAYWMWRRQMEWAVFLLVAVVIELYTLFIASRRDER